MGALVQLISDNENQINSTNIIDRFLNTFDADNTVIAYKRIIKEFFETDNLQSITIFNLRKITYINVEEYILKQTKNKSKNTIKQAINCLRALYKYVIRDERRKGSNLITINPFADEEIKELLRKNCETDDSEVGRALSKKEISMLINTIKNAKMNTPLKQRDAKRDETLIKLMLRIGCRKEEVINFNWYDIEYNSIKNIYIIKILNGKGNKTRQIHLVDKMYNELMEWKEVDKKIRKDINDNSIFGLKDLSNVNKILKKWSNLARIGHIEVHDLRRTFATQLELQGVPISIISKALGHANEMVTIRYLKKDKVCDENLEEYIVW